MAALRILQIGTGRWGAGWARILTESRWSSLVGLVDIDHQALTCVANSVALPEGLRFASLAEALNHVEADAALVVVPPEAHGEVAIEVLEAGLHCLVEKPFAPTYAEAREIVDAATRVGRRIMVAQSFRFRRGPRTIQRLIQEDAIGPIESVHARLFKYLTFTGFRTEMDEPFIIDQAIHHFDIIRGILALEPLRVRAFSFNPSWSYFKGNASAFVELVTDDGAVIAYSGSWVSRGGPAINTTIDGSWDIQGPRGAIQWSHNRIILVPTEMADIVYRKDGLEREAETVEISLVSMDEEERWGVLAEFAAALREDREPESSGAENLGSLALTLAAVESARRDTWVDVEEFVRECSGSSGVRNEEGTEPYSD